MSSSGLYAPTAWSNTTTPYYKPFDAPSGGAQGPTGPTGPKGDPGTGNPATWSQFPATQNVDMAGFNIESTLSMNFISSGNVGIYANQQGIIEIIGANGANMRQGAPELLAAQNLADDEDLNIQSDKGISFQAGTGKNIEAFSTLDMNNNEIINCPSFSGTQNLENVLTNGNSAGTLSINMNGNDITNVGNLHVSYITSEDVGNPVYLSANLNAQNNNITNINVADGVQAQFNSGAFNSVQTASITNALGSTVKFNKDIDMQGSDIDNVNDLSMTGALATITNTSGTINVAAAGVSINSLGSCAINSANVVGFSSSIEKFDFKDNTLSSTNATDLTLSDITAITNSNGNSINFDAASNLNITSDLIGFNGSISVEGTDTLNVPNNFKIIGLLNNTADSVIYVDSTTGTLSYGAPDADSTTWANLDNALNQSQFPLNITTYAQVNQGYIYKQTGITPAPVVCNIPFIQSDLSWKNAYLVFVNYKFNVGGSTLQIIDTASRDNFVNITLNVGDACIIQYGQGIEGGGALTPFVISSFPDAQLRANWSEFPATSTVNLSSDSGITKQDLTNAGNIDTVNLKVNEISPILPLISSDIGVVGNLVFDPAVGSGSVSNITELSGNNAPISVISDIDMNNNAINNCSTITAIQGDITAIQGDITDLQNDKLDKSEALYVNSYYVNDNVNDIQNAIDDVNIQQGKVIYVSAGSYGGSTLTLSQSNNIMIMGPGAGGNPSVICELAGGRGMTLTSGSQRVRVSNLQIEGLLTLGASGNNYFQSVQCLSGITISPATSGSFFFYDCEISGPITVPNTFSGLLAFVRVNFSGASFTLNNFSPLQVQITQCINLPVLREGNATYSGTNADVNLLITENSGNVICPKISAPSGVVDIFTNNVKRVFFNDSGINMNASTDGIIMNGGDITGANNITCSTLSGRFSGPFSTQRCSTLGSELTYNSGTGALSLLSQTGSTLSTITVSGGGGGSFGFYEYNANIADTVPPPGNGNIRWNNETQPLATELYVSHLTRLSQDIDVFLESIVQGDTLIIQDQDNSALFQKFIVNGVPTTVSNTYWTFPVMLDTSSTSFTAGQNIALIPLHTSVAGVQSVSAGDGITITGTASEPIVNAAVIDIVAGTNITIDEANGIFTINASGGGGGGVSSVVAGQGISIDNTDPAAPVVSANLVSNNGNLSISDNLITGQKVFDFQEAPNFTSVNTGSITNSGDLTLNPLGTSRKVIIANADVEITGVNKTFIGNLTGNADSATNATNSTTAATATNALACSGNSATATLATSSTNVQGGSANSIVYNSGVSTTTFLASDPGALVKFNNSTGVPETVLPISLTVGAASIAGEATNIQSGQAGDIPYQTGISTTEFLPIGLTDRILTSSGTAPQWTSPSSITVGNATSASNATNITGGTSGAVLYQSSSGTTDKLAIGSAGQVLTSNGSIPAYVNQSTLSVGSSNNITGGSAGNLLYQSATGTTSSLSNGTAGQVLVQGATNPIWTTVSLPYYYSNIALAQNSNTFNTGTDGTLWRSNLAYNFNAGDVLGARFTFSTAGTPPAGNVRLSHILQISTTSAFSAPITLTSGNAYILPSFVSASTYIFYVSGFVPTTGTYFVRIRTLFESAGITTLTVSSGTPSLTITPSTLAA